MTTTQALDEATQGFLKALASETRQQMLLLFAGDAELTVGEIATRSGLSQSTTSEQLALLRRGGLVTSRRDGKLVRYRVDPEAMGVRLQQLQAYLTVCCPPASLAPTGETGPPR
ncbi:ArsR/SmtB family transcription factor [Actinoplanes auranticolor]|uniref:HTH arsR-type domain-containing protein n=1 Tax=Actinoplanes auranticolor TaxID=47988 RepID=A0A919S9F7_9ACTN|nr:metalloregulator ArsR/SmtB family transcription factor [Actinoplanes auranticolor]GIM67202.1 hypothetical protein Aau02nite_26370 [Actinoplanes auranticolor]